jgi:predicted transcriptional regulator
MAVFKTHYKVNYYLQIREISLKAKGLLSVLLDLDDPSDWTIGRLSEKCKESKPTIIHILQELKKFKFVVVEKLPPNKSKGRDKTKYIYHVSGIPLSDLEFD